MHTTLLSLEEPHLSVHGELSPEDFQQTVSSCDSASGTARSQSMRAIQLFPAGLWRARAPWEGWAWLVLDIHFTLEKTRLLSGFCFGNRWNRQRTALFPIPLSLRRSLFTILRRSPTRTKTRRNQVH